MSDQRPSWASPPGWNQPVQPIGTPVPIPAEHEVTLDDVFGGEAAIGRRPQPSPTNYFDNLRRNGGLRNRVIQPPVTTEATEKPKFRINWENTRDWGTEQGAHVITDMSDEFLFGTVMWIVRNMSELFLSYGPTTEAQAQGLATATWLRDQPLFRALVKECVRRQFTYPTSVYAYLKRYVLDGSGSIDGYVPWKDPAATYQAVELSPLADMPLVPPEVAYGKHTRVIDF